MRRLAIKFGKIFLLEYATFIRVRNVGVFCAARGEIITTRFLSSNLHDNEICSA